MAVMDEQVPGASPQGNALSKLLMTMFGRPPATAGMAQPQSTPGMVGGAPPQLAGGPPGGAPAGANPGVPSNALAPAVVPNPTRPSPGPSQISQGPMEYASKGGRDAAVVSSGIENLSEAIHGFKSQKDASELAKAQNTMKIYQQASQIDPQTGQPVDPYTKHLYENDPKIVKSWEKYLKMEFPREAADPSKKDAKGKPAQGAPHIPAPQADPGEQLKQLIQQKMLAGLRSGQLSPSQLQSEAEGATALSPEDWQKAMKAKYGLTPSLKDAKADEKIDAEIARYKAESDKFLAEKNKLEADASRIPVENSLDRARIKAEIALASERYAQAQKALRDTGQAKSLQGFKTGRDSIKQVMGDVSKELAKSRSASMASRSKIGKTFGSTPDTTPEQEAAQERVSAINDAYSKYTNMQDDVVNGTITPSEAMDKARRSANLTSDYQIWNGLPPEVEKAFPAKGVPDGTPLNDPNGVTQAVAVGGKWVAP